MRIYTPARFASLLINSSPVIQPGGARCHRTTWWVAPCTSHIPAPESTAAAAPFRA